MYSACDIAAGSFAFDVRIRALSLRTISMRPLMNGELCVVRCP